MLVNFHQISLQPIFHSIIRIKFVLLSVFILLLLLNFTTNTAKAASIGVSPAEVDLELEEGSVLDYSVQLSRSESAGAIVFDISLKDSNAAYLDFSGQTQITIPEEQIASRFYFKIDATKTKPGKYQNIIYYHLPEQLNSDGSHTRFGLGEKISITILPKKSSTIIERIETFIINYKYICIGFLSALFAVITIIRRKLKARHCLTVVD